MNKKYKKIPIFKNKKEEISFWEKQSFVDYIDWSKAEKSPVFPSLKPSTRTISIRLPESMLNDLKINANKRDIPYQSLMKMILSREIKKM